MDARTEPSALDLPPEPTLAERLRERIRLSPINLRRWQNFKANRRGYISFWLFLAMFFASLGAELIANDRPILARYKGELLMPMLVDYPEQKFGGFLAVTDYRDPEILNEIEKNGWINQARGLLTAAPEVAEEAAADAKA